MKTVAELEAELKEAQRLEREQEDARKREIAKAKTLEEITLTDSYVTDLQKALQQVGIESTIKGGKVGKYGGLDYFARLTFPDGSDAANALTRLELQHRSVSYSSNQSYQFQFGDYGKKKTYPRLKDGTFNYAKIAEEFKSYVEWEIARKNRREASNANYKTSQQLADALEAEFPNRWPMSVWGCTEDAAKVQLRLESNFTPDEARQVLQTITAIMTARKEQAAA